MSLFSDASSTTGLLRAGSLHPLFPAAPYYPFWMAGWYRPADTGVANRYIISFGNESTNGQDYFTIIHTTANSFNGIIAAGGTTIGCTAVVGVDVGQWGFFFFRIMANNNRRCEAINFGTGLYAAAANTTSATDTAGLSGMGFTTRHTSANTGPLNGLLAEVYYGTGLPWGTSAFGASLLREIAMRGPFDFPELMNGMLEYKSFLQPKNSFRFDPMTDYWKGGGKPSDFSSIGADKMIAVNPPYLSRLKRPRDRLVRAPY